jgi:hypothetical protein
LRRERQLSCCGKTDKNQYEQAQPGAERPNNFPADVAVDDQGGGDPVVIGGYCTSSARHLVIPGGLKHNCTLFSSHYA